jgi:hypothetical protein
MPNCVKVKLLRDFEKWCKFSSCVNMKPCKMKSLKTRFSCSILILTEDWVMLWYSEFLLLLSWAPQLSQGVLVNAGFKFYKAAVRGAALKKDPV